MRDYRPRSSYESDNVPRSKAVARRAERTMIGQELRARYEVPQDLPHEMLTLLMQLNEREGRGIGHLSACTSREVKLRRWQREPPPSWESQRPLWMFSC